MAIIDNNLKVHTCLEFYTKLGMIHISYQKYHSNLLDGFIQIYRTSDIDLILGI